MSKNLFRSALWILAGSCAVLAHAEPPNPAPGHTPGVKVEHTPSPYATRMDLYLEIATGELPSLDEGQHKLVDSALERPYIVSTDSLAPAFKSFEPQFKSLHEAWSIASIAGEAGVLGRGGGMELVSLATAAKLQCCRAQSLAAKGDIDGATRDLADVWMLGHTFELSAASFVVSQVGLGLRSIALAQLKAMAERFPLTANQRDRIVVILATERPATSTMAVGAAVDLNVAFAARIEKEKELANALGEILDGLAAKVEKLNGITLDQARPVLDEYDDAAKQAVEGYVMLNGEIASVRAPYIREIAANSLENVLATALITLRANELAGGKPATAEDVKKVASGFDYRLADPCTGKPLLIQNAGGADVAVFSAGPDGKLEPEKWNAYDSKKNGEDSAGDIFVRIAPAEKK